MQTTSLIHQLLVFLSALWTPFSTDTQPSYEETKTIIQQERQKLSERWGNKTPPANVRRAIEKTLVDSIDTLADYWLGTRWALGSPQTTVPQVGKINCGTFVGRLLHDIGFDVDVKKLQRQPSQLIIKSFVGNDRIRKFSNASMKRFLSSVREMGNGLFIIGLDFHVGFLIQTDTDLRFLHASFETETVVNESAADAMPITTSGYRVVGKILSDDNLLDWLQGQKIAVKGKW
jgi:hypothetical protein